MPADRETIRRWLVEQLQSRGRGARAALAKHLGVPSQAISRMTSDRPEGESRKISATELLRMAEFFGSPPPMSGHEAKEPQAGSIVPVMGYVGAGGEVEPDLEQVPPDGFDQVQLNARLQDDMIGFKVVGSSMPSFRPNDIVVVPREGSDPDGALYKTVVARTGDGRRYLKELRPGRKPHTYTLVSEDQSYLPIEDARLLWVARVFVVITPEGYRSLRRPIAGLRRTATVIR